MIIWQIILLALLGPRVVWAEPRVDASSEFYSTDIDLFMSAGADAYLAWQYSGDAANPIDNDPFSFFQGGETCRILQAAGSRYPGKIGVNIFNLQKRYQASGMDGRGVGAVDLGYLKNSCGTSIVRFFGTDNPNEVLGALSALSSNGIKGVIALHNFAINGTLDYFVKGNYESSLNQARQVASGVVSRGLTGAVYTLELSNEPHCGNDAGCIANYVQWAKDMVEAIRSTGYNGPISLGQASQVSRDSRGDSIEAIYQNGETDFEFVNKAAGVNFTSGHHYDVTDENLKALELSKKMGKTFYVGEAAKGSSGKRKLVPDDNGGPIKSFGKALGAAFGTNGLSGKITDWFSKKTANGSARTGQKITINGGNSSGVEDYSINFKLDDKIKKGQGYVYDQVAIKQPNRILDMTIAVLDKETATKTLQSLQHEIIGFSPEYREIVEDFVGPANQTYMRTPSSPSEYQRNTFDFKSGIVSQGIIEADNSDDKLKDWLCRLGASSGGDAFLADGKTRPVGDFDISEQADRTAFEVGNSNLVNKEPDWSKDYGPIRASSVYCAMSMASKCGGKYGPQIVDCGNLAQIPSTGKLFQVYKTRVKEKIAIEDNYAGKAFIESTIELNDPGEPSSNYRTCEELMGTEYGDSIGLPKPPKPGEEDSATNFIAHTDWGGLGDKERQNILTLKPEKSGVFYISTPNSCRMSLVTPFTAPNLTTAYGASNLAMNFMPQAEKDKIQTPPSPNYQNASTGQVVNSDKFAKLSVINQPRPEKEVYIYEPATGNLGGAILAGIERLVKLPATLRSSGVKCLVSVFFGKGELGTDRDTGEPSPEKNYEFELCKQKYSFEIQTTLYVPSQSQSYAMQTKIYSNSLVPQTAKVKFENQLKKAYGGKLPLDAVDIRTKLDSARGIPDDKEFARQDMGGNKGFFKTDAEIRDQNTLKGTSVYINESQTERLENTNKWMLPSDWQKDWEKL